jgi:L-rhamnose 1-dehydrogenase
LNGFRKAENKSTLTLLQAIALDYIRHGAKVSISHLGGAKEDTLLDALRKDVNEIEADAANTRFLTVPGDISQPETGQNFVTKTVEAFGRLDVFVSNAGVCHFAEFLE